MSDPITAALFAFEDEHAHWRIVTITPGARSPNGPREVVAVERLPIAQTTSAEFSRPDAIMVAVARIAPLSRKEAESLINSACMSKALEAVGINLAQ